jgi:putative membrane protein insertion efficiency factor
VSALARSRNLSKRWALTAVRAYQIFLSPYLGRHCRFYPTCSHYAAQAIDEHGLLRGGVLTLGRLSRCHPFHSGGVDLVPAPTTKES